MHLVPIPDATGKPAMWVNPDHIVSVSPSYRPTEHGVRLDVEIKIEGSQMFTARLSEYADLEAAAAGFKLFLATLQAGSVQPETDQPA